MARTRTPTSIPKSVAIPGQPQIYAEGKHDYDYLTALANSGVILPYAKGTVLSATEVKLRIEAIKRDLNNDAIECVIWIADGGDQHIKTSKHFVTFYKEWLGKKDGEWKKLHILINSPCLEYWFLLHRVEPPIDTKEVPVFFKNGDELLESAEFKEHCPEGKGANLVRAIANNSIERKKAIKRAEKLSEQLINLTDKNLLSVARSEMYQVFKLITVVSPSY